LNLKLFQSAKINISKYKTSKNNFYFIEYQIDKNYKKNKMTQFLRYNAQKILKNVKKRLIMQKNLNFATQVAKKKSGLNVLNLKL